MKKTDVDIQYKDVSVNVNRNNIQAFISTLIQSGFSLYWGDNDKEIIVTVRLKNKIIKLKFKSYHKNYFKLEGSYSLINKDFHKIFSKFIYQNQGCVTIIENDNQQKVIKQIFFGENIKVIKENSQGSRILLDKKIITMADVEQAYNSNSIEERIKNVLHHIDLELEKLHQAIKENNSDQINKSKRNLSLLQKEKVYLEV